MSYRRSCNHCSLIAAVAAIFAAAASLAVGQDGSRVGELIGQYDAAYDAERYVEAEQIQRQLLKYFERTGDQKMAALSRYYLGRTLNGQRKFADAEALIKGYLESPHLTADMAPAAYYELGSIYDSQGRTAESLKMFSATLAQQEKNDDEERALVITLLSIASAYRQMHRLDEAQKHAERTLTILEKLDSPDPSELASAYSVLGNIASDRDDDEGCIRFSLKGIAVLEQHFGREHPRVATELGNLASSYIVLHRFDEAKQALDRGLQIAVKTYGWDNPLTVQTMGITSWLYSEQGKYSDAINWNRRALAGAERVFGPDHPHVAYYLDALGDIYTMQFRPEDALPLFQRSYNVRRKSLGPNNPDLERSLRMLAQTHTWLRQYEQAEKQLLEAIRIHEAYFGPDHVEQRFNYVHLGELYVAQERYDEAESISHKSYEMHRKVFGDDAPQVMDALGSLADVYYNLGRVEEARPLVDHWIDLERRFGAKPSLAARYFARRASLRWRVGERDEAVADVRRAMDVAEQHRAQLTGEAHERAGSFANTLNVYEWMVEFQCELGDCNEALAAMERGRAQSLIDLMRLQGRDLLAGVPADRAQPLRERQTQSELHVADARKQLEQLMGRELSPAQHDAEEEQLAAKLDAALAEVLAVQGEIRDISPIYRAVFGESRQTVNLNEMRDYVRQRRGVLLQYLLGRPNSYLLVVPFDGQPQLVSFTVSDAQAEILGVSNERWPTARLASALVNADGTGVVQQLRMATTTADAEKLQRRLATLWEVLVPAAQRADIVAGKYDEIIVVPDGSLAILPFDALVVETGDDPRYLLDVGPPVVTCPSATVLVNLAKRPKAEISKDSPVLTLGDPAYDLASSGPAVVDDSSRAARMFGKLKRLPYSNWETAWVKQVFEKQGFPSKQLKGSTATESQLRLALPGRQFIHLACHGLSDAAHGNAFGALALAPGTSDPRNDGFLTLNEIYQLQLERCELAILSACDTNCGPQQRGEGVWSLSRGFLVAGARRIVASNWLVDDKAAASLVTVLCQEIAASEKSGKITDYAASLHKAKKWVRSQDEWQSPFYWGTFSLIGPN